MRCWLMRGVVGICVLCISGSALAKGWTQLPGKSGVHYHDPSPLVELQVNGYGFTVAIADPNDAIGACAANGSIYMEFSEKNARYFYAQAAMAMITKKPVYLQIDCQSLPNFGIAPHLLLIQLNE